MLTYKIVSKIQEREAEIEDISRKSADSFSI